MSISVLLEVVRCNCSKRTPVNIDLSDFTGHENDTIYKEEQQNICEGPLTETERLAALKTMETEKTPGWDGSVAAAGADPGFFLGGGALVSCSTSTPINHIVFFFAEYQLY